MRITTMIAAISLSDILRRPAIAAIAVVTALVIRPAAAAPDAADAQAAVLQQSGQKPSSQNTRAEAQWFPDAGLGLFIHWGIASVKGEGDLSWCMLANKSWYDATITPNDYYRLIDQWRPEEMDFDRILGEAKAAGFQYAVFTTKHHDGFTMWPSEFGDTGTRKSFGGRDFVKEFVEACRRHGLKVGFYYSPPDWRFDRNYRSWSLSGKKLDMDHKEVVLPPKPVDHDRKRAELVRGQVTELLTRYGTVDLIWFDGGKGEIPNDEVRRLQPGIVINRRNGGAGDYGDSEGKLPDKRFSGWFESCVTVWPMRKWSYSKEYPQTGAPMTLAMLSILRAWGGNLLANVGPAGDGSLPAPVRECWNAMADWMKHSGESVIGTRPGPWPERVNVPVTMRDGAAYLHFLPRLPENLPGLPDGEKTFTQTKQVIPPLPEYSDTAVWTDAPKPEAVTLLRTGTALPFDYTKGTLTVKLPANHRTDNVDIVKVSLKP